MQSLPKSTAKDVFVHLLAYAMLYIGVVSFIALYFQYINVSFPDALNFFYESSLDIVRSSMAALIVVWPVFILLTWIMNKDRDADPTKQLGVHKWLVYLTLFVTAVTVIVDLITHVRYFLDGEITPRFILKVLIVLVTALLVFGYEFWDLKRTKKQALTKWAAIGSSVLVVATIVLGFLIVGSPIEQRHARFDEQRTQDLSWIQQEVFSYYQRTQTLPTSLTDLNANGFVAPVDPVTKAAYEYHLLEGKNSFELCATFVTTSPPDNYTRVYGETWNHGPERTCFKREVNPTAYPPLDPVKVAP